MPLPLIEQALNMMSAHQVIPVVLWDDKEFSKLPKFGFGNMIDPETGMTRTIFFRDKVRVQFEEAFTERKLTLDNMFSRFESQAVYVSGKFNPDALSHYFEQYMSL